MLLEMRLVEITFLAQVTLVVALVVVHFDVRAELRGRVEAIGAVLEVTGELRRLVVLHVTLQVLPRREHFLAHFARQIFLLEL